MAQKEGTPCPAWGPPLSRHRPLHRTQRGGSDGNVDLSNQRVKRKEITCVNRATELY